MKTLITLLKSVKHTVLASIAQKRPNFLALLATVGVIGMATSMGAAQALGNKPSAPASARYIVKFKAPQSNKGLAVLEASAKTHSVSIKPEIQINPQMGAFTFTAPKQAQLDAYLKALQTSAAVEYIEIDGIMKTQ